MTTLAHTKQAEHEFLGNAPIGISVGVDQFLLTVHLY